MRNMLWFQDIPFLIFLSQYLRSEKLTGHISQLYFFPTLNFFRSYFLCEHLLVVKKFVMLADSAKIIERRSLMLMLILKFMSGKNIFKVCSSYIAFCIVI